jgi:hypothetical protein
MLLNRKRRVVAAVTSALAGAAIGGRIAVANATPAPPPPAPPTVVDTPEPGDSPDVTDAADADNVQEGDQNGPEVPDTPAPPAPPPLTLCERLASRRRTHEIVGSAAARPSRNQTGRADR